MTETEWRLDEVVQKHYVWKKTVYLKDGPVGGSVIWKITNNYQPPHEEDGGYYSREAALQLKGLPIR